MDEQQIREQIVEVARRCYDRGLCVAGDGNISVRVAPNRIMATSLVHAFDRWNRIDRATAMESLLTRFK